MRVLFLFLVIVAVSGCKTSIEDRADLVIAVNGEDAGMVMLLRERIAELKSELKGVKYTEYKFCAATWGWYFTRMVCRSPDTYPAEWRESRPVNWWYVLTMMVISLVFLGVLLGACIWLAFMSLHETVGRRRLAALNDEIRVETCHKDKVMGHKQDALGVYRSLLAASNNLRVAIGKLKREKKHLASSRDELRVEVDKLKERKHHLSGMRTTSDDNCDEGGEAEEKHESDYDDDDSGLF